jgi:hypothetical protein
VRVPKVIGAHHGRCRAGNAAPPLNAIAIDRHYVVNIEKEGLVWPAGNRQRYLSFCLILFGSRLDSDSVSLAIELWAIVNSDCEGVH